MTWNYRVAIDDLTNGDRRYTLIEVYYDDDGVITMWTGTEATLSDWESEQDLRATVEQLKQAFDRPFLRMSGLPGVFKTPAEEDR